ncbi:response regulator transcription factor [Deefgea piscis]|uniref:Response regulator transcription factor n=1 Tax=Deefgea piscis TaxID=2739061 RepID=A0A6M8SUV4_9NEIS|nr:response regulator transcription factor [Deefgea piscis]QKJ67924.1 response regulator transcription factor [Deefgea piscis]
MHKKPSCVVIDDDGILRNLMASLMRSLEFEVVGEASHAQDGFRFCLDLHPKLVLLDINLPESNGIDLLGQILKLEPAPKVIMVTAEPTAERVRTSLTMGASGFLVKPFTAAKLIAAVNHALEMHL